MSTSCVNTLRQQPASTPCVNTLRQHHAVPRAHYKGNPQFPLFPGPTTKEIFNFLCSQSPLQRKSAISFAPRAPSCVNTLRQQPESIDVQRLTPVPQRRPTGLQAIWKVARNCPGKGGASGSIIGCVFRPFGVRNPSSIKNCPFTLRQQQIISKK